MTAPAEPVSVTVAFGRRVRELRQERGWSLRHAGTLVSLNWGTLCKIENGAGTTLGSADRIAGVFGKSLSELVAPVSCGQCLDSPPAGFACQACGAKGPEAS